MNTKGRNWERLILDAAPPVKELGSLAVGDLDGDGHVEVVLGGDGGLLWYRPATFEHGLITEGHLNVGLALEDLDGDGVVEVVTARERTILWFKPGADLHQPWAWHTIDSACNGGAHDLLFCDVDGDGARELLANAAYCEVPGVFIYKPGMDLSALWHKHTVSTGIFSEGLGAGDLDGDGRIEIVHGPDWFTPPPAGPFSGLWQRTVVAPSFREMCRTALVDITGNGRYDVVIVESEYPDGRMSWFENRLVEDAENPWVEHEMGGRLESLSHTGRLESLPHTGRWNFAHSLGAWREAGSGQVHVFVAEMAAGGWNQPYNWDARLVEYTTADGGKTWRERLIDRETLSIRARPPPPPGPRQALHGDGHHGGRRGWRWVARRGVRRVVVQEPHLGALRRPGRLPGAQHVRPGWRWTRRVHRHQTVAGRYAGQLVHRVR